MALHIGCLVNKNSLLQCYFLAILPTGKEIFTSVSEPLEDIQRQDTDIDIDIQSKIKGLNHLKGQWKVI